MYCNIFQKILYFPSQKSFFARNIFSENISILKNNIICAEATKVSQIHTRHLDLFLSVILWRGSKAYEKMTMGNVMLSIGELGFTGIRACTRWSLAWPWSWAIAKGFTKHKDAFQFLFSFSPRNKGKRNAGLFEKWHAHLSGRSIIQNQPQTMDKKKAG